ncbi:MAG: protein translocase subunit SecD [bacterium]|nr:protein translocase subunit SecD [bacterium]
MPERLKGLVTLAVVFALVLSGAWYFGYERPLLDSIKQGEELQGGIHVLLEAVDSPQAAVNDHSMRKAVDIIRFRVDRLGVGETRVQRIGVDRIIVGLPGIGDPDRALDVIGRTALLEFLDDQNLELKQAGEEYEAIITGADLKEAQPAIERGRNVVLLALNPEGTRKFGDATARLIQRPIHIVLDGEVVQSPIVQDHITGGSAEITGYESLDAANRVAIVLNSGALPVELRVVETRAVSATLGQDSLARSKTAALIGISLVVAYMVLYYRGAGLVANLALTIYVFLLLGLLAGLNAALTLPGIAGIILSVGMAVDANVIVFERIREELRLGKTVRSAVEGGFSRALRAILDANVTTLIAAGVLYKFGSDRIQGFAVTLSLGILASMFTAVVITRFLLRQLIRADLVRNTRFFFGV